MSYPSGSRYEGRDSFLYRYYDAEGELLYVGIALDPWSRLCGHASSRPLWLRFAAQLVVDLDKYATRDDAEAAEQHVIEQERPVFNIAGHPSRGIATDRIVDYIRRRNPDPAMFEGLSAWDRRRVDQALGLPVAPRMKIIRRR